MEPIKTISMNSYNQVHVPVTAKVKKLLSENQGKVGAAASLVAGTIFVSGRYFSPILEIEPAPVSEVALASEEMIASTEGTFIATESTNIVKVAEPLSDFEAEFARQRETQGPGGIFEYNGKIFNTFFKEEWESMDQKSKTDYYHKVSGGIEDDKLHLVISDGQGDTAILAYNDHNIMDTKVIDQNNDGIMDVVQEDLNMDGGYESTYEIDKIVVTPEAGSMESTKNVMIDDNEINLAISEEVETISPDDQTLVNTEVTQNIENQNIINDDEIGKYGLRDIIDDMNMDEFM